MGIWGDNRKTKERSTPSGKKKTVLGEGKEKDAEGGRKLTERSPSPMRAMGN